MHQVQCLYWEACGDRLRFTDLSGETVKRMVIRFYGHQELLHRIVDGWEIFSSVIEHTDPSSHRLGSPVLALSGPVFFDKGDHVFDPTVLVSLPHTSQLENESIP